MNIKLIIHIIVTVLIPLIIILFFVVGAECKKSSSSKEGSLNLSQEEEDKAKAAQQNALYNQYLLNTYFGYSGTNQDLFPWWNYLPHTVSYAKQQPAVSAEVAVDDKSKKKDKDKKKKDEEEDDDEDASGEEDDEDDEAHDDDHSDEHGDHEYDHPPRRRKKGPAPLKFSDGQVLHPPSWDDYLGIFSRVRSDLDVDSIEEYEYDNGLSETAPWYGRYQRLVPIPIAYWQK